MDTQAQDYIYDNETAKEIGDTIISQMGGYGKLQTMIGAKHFQYSRNGEMTFQFSLCKKAKWCRITLKANDLYKMEFIKISSKREKIGDVGGKAFYITTTELPKTVETFDDIYNDMLKPVFEKYTGLRLSLF